MTANACYHVLVIAVPCVAVLIVIAHAALHALCVRAGLLDAIITALFSRIIHHCMRIQMVICDAGIVSMRPPSFIVLGLPLLDRLS